MLDKKTNYDALQYIVQRHNSRFVGPLRGKKIQVSPRRRSSNARRDGAMRQQRNQESVHS